MKIFLTGGTGFIGRYTVELLTKNKHDLKLLVRKNSDISFLKKYNLDIIEGNLTDKQSLLDGMKDCDSVINIAGLYTFWEPDNKIYRETNVNGTRNVMESVLESGIKKVVHISTAGIYGKPLDDPFKEESQVGPVQFSEYFKTKYEGESIAWDLYKKRGLPLVVIYPVCVLGIGDKKPSAEYLINLINKKLPATIFKKRTFSFVHVKDVAKAIVNALEKENNIGQKYLISACSCTWKELNEMVSRISDVRLPILELPESITMMNAYLLTGLSRLTKKPPLWGMAVDQMKVMKAGFNVDGSKARIELGIDYIPIQSALEEEIDSIKSGLNPSLN